MTTTCYDCQTTVPRHAAHLRSVAFEQVAFCEGCWRLRIAVDEVFANAPAELIARVA